MTPEKSQQIIHGMVKSLETWVEEAELVYTAYPPAHHLLASLKQAKQSLKQMIERD